jgi:hypothetical protein
MKTNDKHKQNQPLQLHDVGNSISSMNEAMKEFLTGIDEELKKAPDSDTFKGAKWAYKIAISQFNNRFNRYCQ